MINGRNVLITGGSSGIGKQLATDLLKCGNKVIITSNNLASLKQTHEELVVISPNISYYLADIGCTTSVKSMADKVLDVQGCPDILINCAGFATYRCFGESPIDEIEQLVNVNLLGAMRCTHFFLPMMIAQGHGSIVNIASIAGMLVITPNGTYSASKHGMVAWSEALKYELARFNIDVLLICPGRVETNFFNHETFRTRTQRPEAQLTIPIEKVSQKIISTLERKKFLTFIPAYYGLLIWLINTFSYFSKPIYGRLLSSRIEGMYHKKM